MLPFEKELERGAQEALEQRKREAEIASEEHELWLQHPITQKMLKKAREQLPHAQQVLESIAAGSSDAQVRAAWMRLFTLRQLVESLEKQ